MTDIFAPFRNLPPRGHHGALGIRPVANGADWAELAMDRDPSFLIDAETGLLASGVIISLIDNAAGAAIMARSGRMQPMATLDLRVDYLRAPRADTTIHARATCYRLARRVAFVSCDAHEGDPADPIARALITFALTEAA